MMMLPAVRNLIGRNKRTLHTEVNGEKAVKKKVYLEYWGDTKNLGDQIAVIIYNWMLERKSISPEQETAKRTHLLTVGSLLGMGDFDAVVWGTGIHTIPSIKSVNGKSSFRKFDVRCIRGPISRAVLLSTGYDCPEIYADPAVIMPLIYMPDKIEKIHNTSIILHHSHVDLKFEGEFNYINIVTSDYEKFIDQIVASKKVITSSLHGIILAEAYGVPTVFLNEQMDDQMMKFFDWYYSTGRTNIRYAKSMEEAISMEPMPLPALDELQSNALNSFPYDLWLKKK